MKRTKPLKEPFMPHIRQRQSGSALIFLMILLLGVAMLALLANRSALLESAASRNSRDYAIARSAAEQALADAANAIGAQSAILSNENIGKLKNQGKGCTIGDTTVRDAGGTGSGNLKAGGDSVGGFVNFDGCAYDKAWWQVLTLSEFETYSVPIGATTGETASGFTPSTADAAVMPKVRSYKAPRVIIEAIPNTTGDASVQGAKYAFRVTAVGYGPTAETVVMLQETTRPREKH